MKFVMLKKHLAEGKIDPCYLITGDDSYIIKKAAEMFRGLVLVMPEFNLHIFSETKKASDIINACKSIPLGSDRTVVEVSNFSIDAKEISEYLKKPIPQTVLIFVAPTLAKNLSAVAKLATVVECDRLDELSLKKWVTKRANDNGCEISEAAAAKLIAYSDRFMYQVETETEKLSSYKQGGKIETKDVEELVTPSLEYKIYELGEAIVSGKKSVAVKTLKTILSGMPASYIISGLYSYFRRLLYAVICKDGHAAEYLGVKEFAITASRRQVAAIPPKKLKEICDRFSQADNDFKSGKISDILALETIVSQTVFEIDELH